MLRIFDNTDTLLAALADFIVTRADQAMGQHGRFSFVLSGGSSPKKLFALLASDAYRTKIDWPKVFFFFGDERYVPATHADSNYRMAQETLFTPLSIAAGQVFRMNTDLPVAEAAAGYEKDIRGYFMEKPVCFDFILLGLGDDAHTASLFPHTPVLHEKEALVKGLYIEKVKMDRITLTAPLINRGETIAFLVYGAGKAPAVQHILEGDRNIDEYPAQLIQPEHGEVVWFLDEPAAANLETQS